LSITQVSDRTKVPPAFIQAAENERYDDFPASLYARGHLAKLSAAYKIPGRQVLSLYESATGGSAVAGTEERGGTGGSLPASPAGLGQYPPVLQTESASAGIGHRLTTTVVLLALLLIAGLVVAGFGITHYRSWLMNREDDQLGADPNATSGLEIEEFITEQPLPLKEIPLPD